MWPDSNHLIGFHLGYDLTYGLQEGLFIAVSGGCLVCVMSGGLAAFRHSVVRFLLSRTDTFPWQVQSFLDEAATCILLRRVGAGYSFVHRLLMDYFADLEPTALASAPTTPPTDMKARQSASDRSE